MGKRIAVTGGTGFIGGAVIRDALRSGWEVHSYGRREVPGTTFHYWDAVSTDPTEPSDYDAVIHCAASATDWGPDNEIIGANVRGTVKALTIDPAARFIHISTASVYNSDQRSSSMAREDALLSPHSLLNAYSRSKAYAEDEVMKDQRSAGAIILRPHAVYGPGDTTLLPRVEQAVKRGRLVLPNGGWNLSSLTRIDNLVQVIMEMVEVTDPDHRIYNVADGKPVMLGVALKTILAHRGSTVKVIELPSSVAWKIGKIAEGIYADLGSKKAPALTRYLVSQLGYEQTLNLKRIESQLGRKMPHSDFSDAASWKI